MKSTKSVGWVLFLTSLKLIVYPVHLQTSIKITLSTSLQLLMIGFLFE